MALATTARYRHIAAKERRRERRGSRGHNDEKRATRRDGRTPQKKSRAGGGGGRRLLTRAAEPEDAASSAYSSFTMHETRVVASVAGEEVNQKLKRWMQIAELVFALSVVRYAVEIAVDVRMVLTDPGAVLTLKSVLSMLWDQSSIASPLAITGLIAQARLGLFARQQLVPALLVDATAKHFFKHHRKHQEQEEEEPTIAVSLRVVPGVNNENGLVPNDESRLLARRLVPDDKAWAQLVSELFPFLTPLANLFQRLALVVLTIELPKTVNAVKALVATGVTSAV